ncbi:hypothetical protein [Candidatus Tisiphia endosymbiont of Parasteatoda lunata]
MHQKQNEAMNQAIDLLINNDTDISTLLKEDGLLSHFGRKTPHLQCVVST